MAPRQKFLFVLTSWDYLPKKNIKTGFYLPELVHPYNALIPHVDIVMATPKGGESPVDPYSVEESKNDVACVDFMKQKQDIWENTEKLESFLGRASEFAGIFYVGGHGPMFDLANDSKSHALIREFYESNKIVSAVCHGPAALVNVKLTDSSYLIEGNTVTGFSNAEEDAYDNTAAMPFLLETEMINHGGNYVKADQMFGVKTVVSGRNGKLITGQNPPSAGVIGDILLEALKA